MPAKIFIAAPWVFKEEACDVGDKLQYIGFSITSRWHDPACKAASRPLAAQEDLDDIDTCEILLLLDWEKSSGKNVEFGYAIAKGKQLFWWHSDFSTHDDYSLYSYLPQVHNIFSWEDLFSELEKCK